ncbi:MAG: hypothetical protein R3245_00235 [Kiloniellales bacterium]|nr:hypothetical protein [Kiloniellales bacterium]
MHLIQAVLLICATGMPRAECQPETAFDVIRAPDSTTFGLCGIQSQGYLASTAFSQYLDKENYLKIVCTKSHEVLETKAVPAGTHQQ